MITGDNCGATVNCTHLGDVVLCKARDAKRETQCQEKNLGSKVFGVNEWFRLGIYGSWDINV